MRLIILLATLAIVLPFVISQLATPLGLAVSLRFLERPTSSTSTHYTIPPEIVAAKPLDAKSLTEWVRAQGSAATGYVTRVMPLDILYLVFLGAFLGVASVTLAAFIRWPASVSDYVVLLLWILPALYIIADFTEDMLIITLLNWPASIEGNAFSALVVFRSIKIASVTAGFAQVLALWLATYIWTVSPT